VNYEITSSPQEGIMFISKKNVRDRQIQIKIQVKSLSEEIFFSRLLTSIRIEVISSTVQELLLAMHKVLFYGQRGKIIK